MTMQSEPRVVLRRGRKPRKRMGPASRAPIPTDAQVDLRQTRAFELSISGVSNSGIATLLGVHRNTIARDIRLEAQRRADEHAGNREALVARSAARYEKWIADGTLRIQEIRADVLAAPLHTKPIHRGLIRLEADLLRKLQRQAEEVMGLHVPVSIDASTNVTNVNVENALAAFALVPPDMRAHMREVAMERREAKAAEQVRLIAEADAREKDVASQDEPDAE